MEETGNAQCHFHERNVSSLNTYESLMKKWLLVCILDPYTVDGRRVQWHERKGLLRFQFLAQADLKGCMSLGLYEAYRKQVLFWQSSCVEHIRIIIECNSRVVSMELNAQSFQAHLAPNRERSQSKIATEIKQEWVACNCVMESTTVFLAILSSHVGMHQVG
jgi:hypothetical protein